MKAPLSWLRDCVDLKGLSMERIADSLTHAGLEVLSTEKAGDDVVLEFEITSNRPDWLSIYGISRELAAIFGRKQKPLNLHSYDRKAKDTEIIIKDLQLCPMYTARIIENVKIKESPPEIKKKIQACGLNSINNVVDITNYCLLEIGHPLHAFDLDKLSLPLYVRRAKEGEKILAIDGKERVLSGDTLVIADQKGVVAIAGVMGSAHTEVDFSTTRILLESAVFSPVFVRRASRYLGLSTESSYRFERGCNAWGMQTASRKATAMIERLAKGKFTGYVKAGREDKTQASVLLDTDKVNRILASDIKKSKMKSIISGLGFKVQDKGKKLKVTVPPFRPDVKIAEDLAEEVARIYGYDKIKEEVPEILPRFKTRNTFNFKKDLKEKLSLMGVQEIMTFSLTDSETLSKLKVPQEEAIPLKNPISQYHSVLRNTLLAGMIQAVIFNLNQKEETLRFFELADVYRRDKKKFKEEPRLGVLFSGRKSGYYRHRDELLDYFDLKGLLEVLLLKYGITDLSYQAKEVPFLEAAAAVTVAGKEAGFLGKVKKDVLASFDLPHDIFYAELDVGLLFKKAETQTQFVPYSRYPESFRDVSFIISREIMFKKVMETVNSAVKEKVIKDITLLDIYEGENIPDDSRSFLLRITFQAPDRTLQSEEVESLMQKVREFLVKQLEATIR